MRRIWTDLVAAAAAIATLTLGGCATSKDKLLPHGPQTMLDVWNQDAGGGAGGPQAQRQLLDAREQLRRPLADAAAASTPADASAYTRSAANEIHRQFQRLPNPDMVLYVFPHLAGGDPAPVPGYSTVFPFYRRTQYAMPGERTEDY